MFQQQAMQIMFNFLAIKVLIAEGEASEDQKPNKKQYLYYR